MNYKLGFKICLSLLVILVVLLLATIIYLAHQDAYCLIKMCGDIYAYFEGMLTRQLEKTCDPNCIADDVGAEPTLQAIRGNSSESLAQLYFYHDLMSSQDWSQLPGRLLAEYWYSENDRDQDPPSVIVFDSEATGTRFIIWRGTQTEAEVALDLEIEQVELEGKGKVHKGFAKLYTELWPDIRDAWVGTDAPDTIIFGHSLGGAMVNLTTENLPNVVGVASAAPRVYDPQSAKQIMETQNNLYALQNQADIIPSSISSYGPGSSRDLSIPTINVPITQKH